jgi:diaminopropionate ammonia-lyase
MRLRDYLTFQETSLKETADVKFCFRYPINVFNNSSRPSRSALDQKSQTIISLECIRDAHRTISSWPGYTPTPLVRLAGLARAIGISDLWYKDEGSRFGLGSFKALGGAYAIFRILQSHVSAVAGELPSASELIAGKYNELIRNLTMTTATAGNHGRSVAWGARLFGCRSVIYVPRQCSDTRKMAIAGYGARVEQTNEAYDQTVRLCAQNAAREGWIIVSDTSWDRYVEIPKLVLQGYSVMTGELINQLGDAARPTHVFVQGGVGGLAAAVCEHFSLQWGEQRPRIIVIEPEGAACLYASAVMGKPSKVSGEVHSIMAGLCCGEPSPLAWEILEHSVDCFVTLPDDAVPDCMRLLATSRFGDQPIVAGESGVAGLAGLLCVVGNVEAHQILGLTAASSVLVFGTEGDTDPASYKEIVGQPGEQVRKQVAN